MFIRPSSRELKIDIDMPPSSPPPSPTIHKKKSKQRMFIDLNMHPLSPVCPPPSPATPPSSPTNQSQTNVLVHIEYNIPLKPPMFLLEDEVIVFLHEPSWQFLDQYVKYFIHPKAELVSSNCVGVHN